MMSRPVTISTAAASAGWSSIRVPGSPGSNALVTRKGTPDWRRVLAALGWIASIPMFESWSATS